jgi:hypothetical protein
MPCA